MYTVDADLGLSVKLYNQLKEKTQNPVDALAAIAGILFLMKQHFPAHEMIEELESLLAQIELDFARRNGTDLSC